MGRKYMAFGIAALVLLASVVVVTFVWPGNGLFNGSASDKTFLTESQINAINVTSQGVEVSSSTSTVYINSSAIIPVLAGSMNAPSMYSFEIFGILNPEIQVKSGVDVHFVVVNIDDDSYHNFVIGSQGPPYYYMGGGMMDSSGGNNYNNGAMMYGYYGNNNSYGYMVNYLPPESSGHYAFTNVSYDFSSVGTYWYLCTYPGHAQQGMYGKIVEEDQ